jgi:hypothetical protein
MRTFELKLYRKYKGETYTIGHLYQVLNIAYGDSPEIYITDTLEDPVRDEKIAGITAIPAGRYEITLEDSPHFKRELPYLHDVPEFTGILIHAGNTPEDTRGCILVGENKIKGQVVNSRFWEHEVTELIRTAIEDGQKVFITTS